jgi:hypothetical protein
MLNIGTAITRFQSQLNLAVFCHLDLILKKIKAAGKNLQLVNPIYAKLYGISKNCRIVAI